MERAAYITKIENILRIDTKFYQRIYFGQEFCERLLPSPEDLKRAIDFARENKLQFTLITPYVTNRGLRELRYLLDLIASETPQNEVVFNDYGVLRMLKRRYPELKPVMGRLLNKMKRDPRILFIASMLPIDAIRYFRGLSIDNPIYRDFLIQNNITRIELDNVFQGFDINLSISGISASIYVPYAYVTTTRACLAINCDVYGMEDIVGIFPCKRECQKYTFYLKSSAMPTILIRKGNTIFVRNEKVPSYIDKIGVDRIVYEIDLI
ncbi:hypothetical protein KEJ12_01320 [Candidatus Bathyarchaeota archaeon]|nr:hypothetical protein [Candidatus Bathyarchaeota archaeon]